MILDGARGAAIRWDKFVPVLTLGQESMHRRLTRWILRIIPLLFFLGSTLVIYSSIVVGKGGFNPSFPSNFEPILSPTSISVPDPSLPSNFDHNLSPTSLSEPVIIIVLFSEIVFLLLVFSFWAFRALVSFFLPIWYVLYTVPRFMTHNHSFLALKAMSTSIIWSS